MSERYAPTEGGREPGQYEIRLKGHLDARWAERFEGMSFTYESDGTTVLSGPVADQAELHGLLRKVRDLGLPLVSVNPVDPKRKSLSNKTDLPANAGSAKRIVAALLLLGMLPLFFGAFRLTELAGGPAILPADARFSASPLPVALHIVTASVYTLLGVFQFAPEFRRRRPRWHRAAGRLLVLCGLLVGLSALWMTLLYPVKAGTGELLYAFRLLFGSAMVVSMVLGFTSIRRGDVIQHRAWMARGFAIGLGAGTQALILMVWEMIIGPPSELSHDLLMGAAWVVNLVIAEWVIRKRPAPRARARSVSL